MSGLSLLSISLSLFLHSWFAHSLADTLNDCTPLGTTLLAFNNKKRGCGSKHLERRGRLWFHKRDTSLFSCARIMFHLADLAPHLHNIPQANTTIKQMEKRFSASPFHGAAHCLGCCFKSRWAFRRISHPKSHGLKHCMETASKNWRRLGNTRTRTHAYTHHALVF